MKKIGRWAVRLLIALPLLIGAAWLVANYQGNKEWQQARERAAKLGVSLDLADYGAPTIPDSENLLKNPDFAREWKGEIEPRLDRWTSMGLDVPTSQGIRQEDGELMDYLQFFPDESDPKVAVEQLTKVTQDVEARLNKLAGIILSYPPQDLATRSQTLHDSGTSAGEIFVVGRIISSLRDQAILALHRNDPNLAVQNCQAIERLTRNFSSPDLFHLLSTKSLNRHLRSTITEGILLQAWNSGHLNKLATLITTEIDRIQIAEAISFEAALIPPSLNDTVSFKEKINEHLGANPEKPLSTKEKIQFWIHHDGPTGWRHCRKAFFLNAHLDQIENGIQGQWQTVQSHVIDLDAPVKKQEFSFDPLYPIRDVAQSISGPVLHISKFTSEDRLCNLAIEIEKIRLTTGAYPPSLKELPQGLPITDLTDPRERPFQYELLPAGGFQLYSLFFKEQFPDSNRKQLHWQFPVKL